MMQVVHQEVKEAEKGGTPNSTSKERREVPGQHHEGGDAQPDP